MTVHYYMIKRLHHKCVCNANYLYKNFLLRGKGEKLTPTGLSVDSEVRNSTKNSRRVSLPGDDIPRVEYPGGTAGPTRHAANKGEAASPPTTLQHRHTVAKA